MRFPAVARRSPAITTPSAKRTPRTVVPWVTCSGSCPLAETDTGAGDGFTRFRSSMNEGPGSSEVEKMGSVIPGRGYRPRSPTRAVGSSDGRVGVEPGSRRCRRWSAVVSCTSAASARLAPDGVRAAASSAVPPTSRTGCGPHLLRRWWGLLPSLLHVRLHEVLGVGLEDLVDLVQQVVELGLDLLALLGLARDLLDDLVALGRRLLLLVLTFGHGGFLALLPQLVEQVGGALAPVEEATHVAAGSTQGFHHRDPPEGLVAHVEHQRVPVGGHDVGGPPLEAPAPEVGPGVLGGLGGGPVGLRVGDELVWPDPSGERPVGREVVGRGGQ